MECRICFDVFAPKVNNVDIRIECYRDGVLLWGDVCFINEMINVKSHTHNEEKTVERTQHGMVS